MREPVGCTRQDSEKEGAIEPPLCTHKGPAALATQAPCSHRQRVLLGLLAGFSAPGQSRTENSTNNTRHRFRFQHTAHRGARPRSSAHVMQRLAGGLPGGYAEPKGRSGSSSLGPEEQLGGPGHLMHLA